MKDAPSGETARQALLATLPDYAKLQQGVNRALVGDVPKPLRERKQHFAIDLHLVPYYGAPLKDPKEIYRSQAKAGTHNFHAYASAYVVFHGQRFTVALTPVEYGEKMKDIVQRLLTLARKTCVRPGLLLLDRGFYSIDVIRYLQRARVPFLMPAVARGRKPAAGEPAKGIRAFQLWKRGGWGQHTLVAGKRKSDRVDLRALWQPPRQTKKTRPLCLGLRLLGNQAALDALDEGHLSQSLRHRDELSAIERGAHQDLYTQSRGAVFLHRLGVDPAQRVGLVALGALVEPASGSTIAPFGAIALQGDVAVVAACC